MENTSIITEKLLALGEPSYRDFSASLMPTVDPATVIGIRMLALRKLASELYGTPKRNCSAGRCRMSTSRNTICMAA